MLEVTSPQNRIIKEIKSLYRRKNRWDKNLFIIEGPKIIEEALTEQIKLKYLVFGESFLENKESAYLIEMAGNYQKIKVTDRLFEEISDTESPQGILAVATFIERRLEDICIKDQPFLVYLDQVQDPGNIGTIIRTADAFNIDGIILGKGTVDPYNPKVVRATMGSIF
ncbi:MAG TPA: RNA methyltransferase, partial [Tissierellaceae bacterium]|nr:RNA methyltransferase [Tissierellaceae bacterium]